MKLIKEYRWTIALCALGLFVLVNLLVSSRPVGFYRMMQVEEIATVPDTPELAEVRRDTLRGSGFIEHLRPAIAPLDRQIQPLKLGWVYKEVGFFGMPYYAENVSYGPILYIDSGYGYSLLGIREDAVQAIESAVGRPVITGYRFAWYWHVWGLAFPLLLFALVWMWRRERHAREERQWTAHEAEA